MNLAPVKTAKAYELIADRLKQEIRDGRLAPGSRLPSVRELSEQLAVSPAAVREALSALQALGFVSVRHGDGTFVQQYNPDELGRIPADWTLMRREDVRALLEVRKILESGSSRLAALRKTADDMAQLQRIIARMEADLASDAIGEQADWELHQAIAQASGNPFLASLMDSIAERMKHAMLASRQALYRMAGERERLLRQHQDIVLAIADADANLAAARMEAHLTHVETRLELAANDGERAETT